MPRDLPYPSSFPNAEEESFIRLLLCSDAELPDQFENWKKNTIFDDIDSASLGLLPLLHLRLSKLAIQDDFITGRIRGVYKLLWFKNQRLLEEARKVTTLCREEDIPVILLKGIPLLLNVYHDPAARFLGDGDLLVHPEHVTRIFALFKRLGWKQVNDLWEPIDIVIPSADAFIGTRTDRSGREATFVNDDGVMIDVHWQVFHARLSQQAIRLLLLRDLNPLNARTKINAHHWEHSVSTVLKGTPCQMLCLEDMLVHVIEHGAKPNVYRPLRWVVDAAFIIRTGKIDWKRLIESAQISGHEVDVFIGFRYLIERQKLQVPDFFWDELQRLPLKRHAIKQYYGQWDIWRVLLGDFPSHWYRYWKYESQGSVLKRCFELPAYLRKTWGVDEKKSLTFFILEKYASRLGLRKAPASNS